MNKVKAVSVLDEVSRMAQKAGILSLEDSAVVLEALNFLKAEPEVKPRKVKTPPEAKPE